MDTTYKPYTIAELVEAIYEDNYSHFDFMENMGGDQCDCHLCMTMLNIIRYWGE